MNIPESPPIRPRAKSAQRHGNRDRSQELEGQQVASREVARVQRGFRCVVELAITEHRHNQQRTSREPGRRLEQRPDQERRTKASQYRELAPSRGTGKQEEWPESDGGELELRC